MIDDCMQLTDDTLSKFSSLSFPTPGDEWGRLVISFLDECHTRLGSIRLLVDKDLDGSHILMRSLFELAVTVNYIAKDQDARITIFKQKLPATDADSEDQSRYSDFFRRSLPSVKDMCNNLGDWALEYYGSAFYKYTSDAAHSGAWTIYRNLGQLIDTTPPGGVDQCRVLATSANLFLHVARHLFEFHSDTSLVEELNRLDSKWGEFSRILCEIPIKEAS